jgi:PAS domain S-box-containing protein
LRVVEKRNGEGIIHRLMESSVQCMWLLDPAGKVIDANRPALSVLSKPSQAVMGRPFWETEWWGHSPETRESVRDAVRRAASGVMVRMETRCLGPGGRHIDVELSLTPVRDEAGAVTGVLPEVRDISDRRRMELALTEATRIAAEANAAKDRFLAMLSHELRTPLAPVLISVSAMEGDPMLPDGLRREITMVRRNVELESRLIDDLLDISRIRSGTLAMQFELVEVNDVMRNVCAMCRAQALDKNLRLEVRLHPDAGRILADPARLQQIMWNLLKNAIRFTPEHGTVAVTTFAQVDNRVRFQVRDTGMGIKPEFMQRIFDAFERDRGPGTWKSGGLGLGLAIARSLVQLHGGAITAESAGPGRGATFMVELPGAASPAENHDATGDMASRNHILLVEDHDDTASALARLLRVQGYSVRCAGSAAEALRALDDEPFDLVLSDIGLPDATGYELMRAIRERWHISGIAMSGYGNEEDMRLSRESGFSEHLVKPMRLNLLDAAIQRLLRQNWASPEQNTPGSEARQAPQDSN